MVPDGGPSSNIYVLILHEFYKVFLAVRYKEDPNFHLINKVNPVWGENKAIFQ